MNKISQRQQKFLLLLPVIVLPFLYLVFYTLGGGKNHKEEAATGPGLNTELPQARFDPKKAIMDKLAAYEKASHDSMIRQKYQQQDPNTSAVKPAPLETTPVFKDQKAEELQQQLHRLQESLNQPPPPIHQPRNAPPESDPQLEKLDGILDKVIRIQHPSEPAPINPPADEVQPADSTANTISAIVPEKQVLVTGATIALRLTDDLRVNKIVIPRGQLVYGVVNINNDRMLIHISAIRSERNIYTTDLQVYDLDGIPGIHIPGQISRDVTKQSADQGINALNLMTYDPSIGSQAANAGVQAAKSLFSKKVRLVRVTVRPGYQLLLRSSKASHSTELPGEKPGLRPLLQPPGIALGGSLIQQFSAEGLDLGLQGIYLKDDVLWFALSVRNSSAITYTPEYTRWFIRDRRVFRRTALQELPITPICQPEQPAIVGDSTQLSWTGFRPFSLTKNKELVIEIGEKNGGRILQLVLHNKHWQTIKKL